MPLPTRVARRAGWLVIPVLAVSCGAPPHPEMDQARGAIDAARAAGAERYAPTELGLATESLTLATEAVAARDYRLALSQALESREQAQHAAATAADTRVRRRGDLARALAEGVARVSNTRERLEASRGLPARSRQTAEQTLAALEEDLQEAGALVEREDYEAAEAVLAGVATRVAEVVSLVARPSSPRTSR